MKTQVLFALIAATEARHHHHPHNEFADLHEMESLESMSTSKLVSGLRSTLDSALYAEVHDDKAAAVAKTAAIKNI